jgi:predicted nucleotidyltransferase
MTGADTIRAFTLRRDQERLERVSRRRDALRAAVPELARKLVNDFGARRVLLFGSLAWGETDENSDIDLAVEGLSAACFFRALGELLAIAPAPVDLVELELAEPGLRARILEQGIPIHV